MAPASSLTGLLNSPNASSNGSTLLANGRTLPDISLGSLGSSFRSENDSVGEGQHRQGSDLVSRVPIARGVSRVSTLPSNHSSDTASSATVTTPSPPLPAPTSALLALSPPMTVRRASSHSALPGEQSSHAPRRSRYLRSASISSDETNDEDDNVLSNVTGRGNRYGKASAAGARRGLGRDGDDDEEEDDGTGLSSLSVGVTPARGYNSGPSKHSGRHSVAANAPGATQMTLREQEQNVDALQKDNFNLQLENHFLKERLASMAPDHIEAALKENIKLKIEILNLSKELKRSKKLLMQQDRDLAAAARSGGSGEAGDAKSDSREMENMWRDEKDRRRAAEAEIARLETELSSFRHKDPDVSSNSSPVKGSRSSETELQDLRARLEDMEASENVWRDRAEALEDEVEQIKALLDDQREETERVRDEADKAQEEIDRLRAEVKGLSESVEGDKERRQVEEVRKLQEELDSLRKAADRDIEALEDQINHFRDKLAAAQLDLDRRDQELDELNAELDVKVQEHEREIGQVEAEWRDEVLESRAQVDELKDVLQEREQDLEEIRKLFIDREEDLAVAKDRIAELEAAQAETHDRLEETLRNIEQDNADKDADLIEANREVEILGQKVYDLEEAIEDYRNRETELNAELRNADEAIESTKTHYETLVTALKEARRKAQDERDDVAARLRREEEAHAATRETRKKEVAEEAERYRRLVEDRDQMNKRLSSELEAARDRVLQKDRDLGVVQSALRSLEDERKKLGDEHTTDRYSLELEIDRVKRDLERCEDELDRARDEAKVREDALRQRDAELAQIVGKCRDLEAQLSSERQGRLNISDKLDSVSKSAKQHEREATRLRERLEELEPLLTETQNERYQLQKQNESQRQERTELLLRVFKEVNKFLGTEDSVTPANFTIFRDTLLQRLRSVNLVRLDFEKRIKETEASIDQRMGSLKRQLDQKWRALDSFETSIKKLEVVRMQWKAKYATKEGELEAAKSRNLELSQQLSHQRANGATESSAQLRSLAERASTAEKRAQIASNQVAQVEARLAELQSRSGQAENKWEARVKEYENRLRIAGEKIKTEKQGGKERALQLEAQVRELERQLDMARKRNERAEGIVASTAHLMPSSNQ